MELREKIREEVISVRILAKTVDEAVDEILLLSSVSNRRELLIAFLDDIHSRSYEHIKSDEGKVDAFLSNL